MATSSAFERLQRYDLKDASKCILFTGAGVSSSAVTLNGSGLPTWPMLCRNMIDDLFLLGHVTQQQQNDLLRLLDQNSSTAFLNIASTYKKLTDDSEYDQFFAQQLFPDGLRPSPLHRAICRAGFRAILTTNFDSLFERVEPDLPVFSYPDFLGRADLMQTPKRFLLKLHGSVLPSLNLKQRLAVTKNDYDLLRSNDHYLKSIKSLLATHSVIAVGYSCKDPDFLQIMADLTSEFRVGPFVYVLMREPPDEKIAELRRTNVKVIPYSQHGELVEIFDSFSQKNSPLEITTEMKSDNISQESLIRLGIPSRQKEPISSGSLTLDMALGTWGWPRGHIVEIIGKAGCGKTTLIMEAIAASQRCGGTSLLIDGDRGTDPITAKRFGIDIDKIFFSTPDSLEEAFDIVDKFLTDDLVDVVAIDSIAPLAPKHQNDSLTNIPYHDQIHRSLLTKYLARLSRRLSHSRAIVLITNHIDEKFGVMFGSPEMQPWETEQLQYYASLRIDIRKKDLLKDENNQVIGSHVRAKVLKNRFAPPYREAEYDMFYLNGISRMQDLMQACIENKIIQKKGGFFYFSKEKIAKGYAAAKKLLLNDSIVCKEMLTRLGFPKEMNLNEYHKTNFTHAAPEHLR